MIRSMHHSFTLVLRYALIAALPASPAMAQSKAETTPLRPSESVHPNRTDQSRQKMLEEAKKIIDQTSVTGQLYEKLAKANDGSPAMALKLNVLLLLIAADDARLVPLAQAAAEEFRWDVEEDLMTKEASYQRRILDVHRSSREIENLAAETVEQETRLASLPKNSTDIEVVADDIADKRAELEELLEKRSSQERDAQQYQRQAEEYRRELADLEKLERRLEGMSKLEQRRVERRLDAIEHHAGIVVSSNVQQDRMALRDLVNTMAARGPRPSSAPSSTKEEAAGVPIGDLLKQVRPKAGTSDAVEAELQKARSHKAVSKSASDKR